jgi:hypothetical protein
MAQGFFSAFNQALPQGLALGQRQQELDMRQEQVKQQQARAMWEELGAIMKTPAGATRKAMLALGAKRYQQTTGEEFPQEILSMLSTANDEEVSLWTEAAGAFADFGFSVPAVTQLMQKSPGAFSQMINAVVAARKQKAEEAEGLQIQQIMMGGGAQSMEQVEPMGGGGMGDLGPVSPGAQRMAPVTVTAAPLGDDLDSQIAQLKMQAKQLMGLKSPQAKALRDDLRQTISQLMAEKRHISSEERADRREARADARAAAADRRASLNSILNPEVFARKMQMAEAMGGLKNRLEEESRPLPAGQAEGLAELETMVGQTDLLRKNYSPSYVGKVEGTLGSLQEYTGAIGEKQATYRAALQQLNNLVGNLRSGQALTGQEIARLQKELPQITDNDAVFKAKLGQFHESVRTLLENKRRTFKEAGYGKTPKGSKPRLNKAPAEMSDDEVLQYLNQEVQ